MSEVHGSTQVEEALDALERLTTAAVGWPNADYEDDRVVADAEIVRELIVRSALRERDTLAEPDAYAIEASEGEGRRTLFRLYHPDELEYANRDVRGWTDESAARVIPLYRRTQHGETK